MEMETLAFHDKVRGTFRTLTAQHPDRIVRIDASQSPDQVFVFDETLKVATQTVKNSLLFAGPDGIGKSLYALELAR